MDKHANKPLFAGYSRTVVVDRFNNDDSIRVMLLTTKNGGLGLNLTGEYHVMMFKPRQPKAV
eukprot:1058588-Ditylum_brightwellii.AAC.1